MNPTCIVLVLLIAVPNLVSSELCEHSAIIPHPQWCSAFFLCRFGFWTVLVCPGGLYYNPDTRRCDFPENVECVNDPDLTTPEWTSPEWTTRTVTWTTPTDHTFTTPSVPTFSTPSVPTFSTPSIPTFSTPSVPTFSTPTFSTHTTPERPTTPEFTTPTRPSIPTRHAVVSKKFCGDPTLPSTLPHELCQYFYKCINDNAIQMKCADDLLWNSDQEHCDHPENVICMVE